MASQLTFFEREQVDVEEAILARSRKTTLERRELGRPHAHDTALILVGCVATKGDTPAPAADLYTSPLFKKRRAYVEARAASLGIPWAILTAHPAAIFGPGEVVAPYDYRIGDHVDDIDAKGPANPWRPSWRGNLRDALKGLLALEPLPDCTALTRPVAGQLIEVHAGAPYVEAMRGAFVESTWPTLRIAHPVKGLQIGEQLRWYNERI